jgi:hypothetical protein
MPPVHALHKRRKPVQCTSTTIITLAATAAGVQPQVPATTPPQLPAQAGSPKGHPELQHRHASHHCPVQVQTSCACVRASMHATIWLSPHNTCPWPRLPCHIHAANSTSSYQLRLAVSHRSHPRVCLALSCACRSTPASHPRPRPSSRCPPPPPHLNLMLSPH